MIIGRDLVEYYEDEKLFSTGNDELDEILEEVYYSGLEDGYDYAQREFAEVDSEGTKWVKELHTPRKKQTKESAKIAKRKLRNEDRADRRDTFRGYMKDYEDFAGDVHKNSILREEAKNIHGTLDNYVNKGLDYANKAGGRIHETLKRTVPEHLERQTKEVIGAGDRFGERFTKRYDKWLDTVKENEKDRRREGFTKKVLAHREESRKLKNEDRANKREYKARMKGR